MAGESMNEKSTRTAIIMIGGVYSSAEGGTMTECDGTAAFIANVTQPISYGGILP